jgi:NAD(P)-dependent dehydrogenase (short-subunit alcohol dehydrogenase family)
LKTEALGKTKGQRMKVAFFTGATGGMGQRCVQRLSASGRWLVFAAGTNQAILDELGKLPHVVPVKVDVTSQASVEAACRLVAAQADGLDALVNFAGLTAFTSAVEGDAVAVTDKLLAVNVMGMVRVNRVFFDLVLRSQGRIINCSSEVGWMTAQPFAAPYVLSKRAVEGYSDSLRRELMFLGIPVIKIQPGSFQTGLTDRIYQGFDQALQDTRHYHDLLTRMKPLMLQELAHNPDLDRLAMTVMRALEAKRPRLHYRIGTGKLLALLEILPERSVDRVYKLFFKMSRFFSGKQQTKSIS